VVTGLGVGEAASEQVGRDLRLELVQLVEVGEGLVELAAAGVGAGALAVDLGQVRGGLGRLIQQFDRRGVLLAVDAGDALCERVRGRLRFLLVV
jgi:hypothetical protein